MRKTAGVLLTILYVLLSTVSCTFLCIGSVHGDSIDPGKGVISVTFGVPARTIYAASPETTHEYLITITGRDGLLQTRKLSPEVNNTRIQLNPGEYTISLVAYDASGVATASDSHVVSVSAGLVTQVRFTLKAGSVEYTGVFVWNIGEADGQPNAIRIKRFGTAPESVDLKDISTIGAACTAYAEDATGTWYTIEESTNLGTGKGTGLYQIVPHTVGSTGQGMGTGGSVVTGTGSVESLVTGGNTGSAANTAYIRYLYDSSGNSFGGPIEDALYYDYSTNTLWACLVNDGDYTLYGFPLTAGNTSMMTATVDFGVASPTQVSTFAVTGSTVYIGYVADQRSFLSVWAMEKTSENVYQVKEKAGAKAEYTVSAANLQPVSGICYDIAIVDEYMYALICDVTETDTGYISIDAAVRSRGALVRFDADLSVRGYKGWLDASKERNYELHAPTEYDNDEFPDNPCVVTLEPLLGSDPGYTPPVTLDIIAPQKADAHTAFYGPRRFVAVRRDELYIADCGVNIRLTDWGESSNDPVLGMEYVHNRIVSVSVSDWNRTELILVGSDTIVSDVADATSSLMASVSIAGAAGYSNEPVLGYELDGDYYYYAESDMGIEGWYCCPVVNPTLEED